MLQYGYALTGSIATGKSTVCKILKENDFYVIDADLIARDELESSKDELRKIYGDEIFVEGAIDRKKLASIIFKSEEEREKLNSLIHPKIRASINELAQKQEKLKKPYIIDIPLFFESGEYECKMVVVVYTPKEIQLKRLMKRENINEEEAKRRITSQLDIEYKKEKADYVIDNSKGPSELKEETQKFINFLKVQDASNKV
ncbi:dephospho-CoA kinase [Sulfurospirillum sp. 1307]